MNNSFKTANSVGIAFPSFRVQDRILDLIINLITTGIYFVRFHDYFVRIIFVNA